MLQPKLRRLAQAMRFVDSPALFAASKNRALPILLEILPAADTRIKHQIMMFLAQYAKDQAPKALFEILDDPSTPLQTRYYAAIQLRQVLPEVESGWPIREKLFQGLCHPGADMRRLCATALGWAGHGQAISPLVRLLNDPAPSVRLAAVAALCQIGDVVVAGRLKKLLAEGTAAEKRAVLLNLWRLEEKGGGLQEIYRKYASHPDADLKLVALALLEPVAAKSNAPLFMAGLNDRDSRVRRLCLERLMRQGRQYLPQARQSLHNLLDDRRMDIKRAALEALKIAEEKDSRH